MTTRYTLTVPLSLNDGTPTPAGILADVERDLLDAAGGFTSTRSVGAWRDWDGRTVKEPVRVYAVDVQDADAATRILEIAERVAVVADQDAVYVTAQEIAPTLVLRPKVAA